MIRWMCGISMKERRTNEELRRLVGVEPITTVIPRWRLNVECMPVVSEAA